MRAIKVLVVVLAMLRAGGEARADHRTSITTSGRCTEYATGVFVDREKAQALVPSGFTVKDYVGKALVVMFAEECETSVDGGTAVPSIVSGVFVGTEPEQSPAGCASYNFFWADSVDGPWLAAMSDLGWRMELIEDSGFVRSLGGVSASVPAELAPWSVEAAAGESPPVEAPLVSVHCHVGPRGLVRGTFDHTLLRATAGAGALHLGAGPVWTALGAESQPVAPGLVLDFTWTGVTEIVG